MSLIRQHTKNKKSFFGRPVWRNSTKTIKVAPQRYYQPEQLNDVVEMVQEGLDSGTPVRAVGSGHSFSTAPKAEGILIDNSKLKKVEVYNFAKTPGNYFEVEGGIRLRDLNRQLDKLGYCLSTMGGIDHQSIAGAISTGTHGTSHTFGGMSKMVKSIVLVTHDQDDPSKAKVYRIEGEGDNALTDPTNYSGHDLIQDDGVFNCAVVCFGTMGIIYSYVLAVENMFYLREKKEVVPWNTVQPRLKDGSIFENQDSLMIQINPYPHKGEQLALVVTQNRQAGSISNRFQKAWNGIKRSTRSLQYELANRVPFILWFAVWRINTFPGYVPKFLNSAIKAQKDEEYSNKAHKVMYQGLEYVKERAFDSEIAVPMDQDGKYVEVIEELMEHLRFLRNEYRIHLTSPINLRFVKGSEVYMTPENGQDTCYIDSPVLLHIYGRDTIISRVQQFLLARNARPHWGKLNYYLDAAYVKNHYPRFDDFMVIMKKFNSSRIFSNIFSKRVLGY